MCVLKMQNIEDNGVLDLSLILLSVEYTVRTTTHQRFEVGEIQSVVEILSTVKCFYTVNNTNQY